MNALTWSLIRRNVPLRRLVVSRLVSSIGTWLAYVALTIDVYARTHSSVWVSTVLLADFVPSIAFAALAGPLLDRIPRRALLVGAELGAAVVFVLLPFAPSATAVVALALVAGMASAVYYPSIRATMPGLVGEADLPHANALSQMAATAGIAAGPISAGVLVSASGVGLAYGLNALSFLISAALLLRISVAPKPVARDEPEESHWHALAEGLRVFIGSAPLRMVLLFWTLFSLGGAAINVGEVFLARDAFHAGTFGFGLLASATGIGLVTGSALAPRVLEGPALRGCRIGLTAGTVGFAAAAFSPNIWVASGCALVGTMGNAILLSSATLLLQNEAGEARLGHAFAMFDGAGFVALGLGMSVTGVALGALGAKGTWLVAAGIIGCAALTSLVHRPAREIVQPALDLS